MKDKRIQVADNSMVFFDDNILGIDGENLQGKIIFYFNNFKNGVAWLEFEKGDGTKGYIPLNKVNETYELEIKSSLLSDTERIWMQLRITQDENIKGIPVFKSNKFFMDVSDAINATSTIKEEYPNILDVVNEKQDKLVAGANITIDGNVISATGGGGVGKSAYEIWLQEGNTGTEQEFLDSLKSGANILYGKTMYSDGDSIAVGAGSNNVSYAHLLAEKYNMTLTSEAISGTTIAVQSGKTDSIYERVTAMTKSYDYILLDGGTNDVSQNIPIGTITTGINEEPDITTILGALEGICKFLTLNYFSSKKLFIFVNSRYDILERTNYTFAKMKEVLEKWGIPYIDVAKINNLGYWDDTVASNYFVSDKLHPTLKAYQEFYLPYIENALLYGGYINSPTSRNEAGSGTLFTDSANKANIKEASYEYQRNGDWIDAHIYVEFNAFAPTSAYHSISLASLPYKCGNKITVREMCVTTTKKQMLWAIATGSATVTLLLFTTNAFTDGEKLSFSVRYKASAE